MTFSDQANGAYFLTFLRAVIHVFRNISAFFLLCRMSVQVNSLEML